MPIAVQATKTRRLRPAAPHGLIGASSLLRLSSRAAAALPSGPQLSGWLARAGSQLLAPTDDHLILPSR